MLAARDQENLVHGHQQVAASKPLNQGVRTLQPKTPGNRYLKTPLKVPIHDENASVLLGGKSVLGTKGKGLDKNVFVTPSEPRTRAPLGMKTTNAKAKSFQTPNGPGLEKTLEHSQKQASARRPTPRVSRTVKLDVHGDDPDPLHDREVEYAPPKPRDIPYESEDFPRGCLDYEALKGDNLMAGWYDLYHNPRDQDGILLSEKEFEKNLAKAMKKSDERILRDIEEDDWTVGDVPETFQHLRKKQSEDQRKAKIAQEVKKSTALATKGPATITSRRAASALSIVTEPKPAPIKKAQPKPAPSFLARKKKVLPPVPTSTMRHTAATAASKSTIGYNRGRTASNAVSRNSNLSNLFDKPKTTVVPTTLPRSASIMSHESDVTITPARFAQRVADVGSDEWHKMQLLKTFEVDDEDLEPGLRGALPECLRKEFEEEEEEEFVMALGS